MLYTNTYLNTSDEIHFGLNMQFDPNFTHSTAQTELQYLTKLFTVYNIK
jgi:hypothetical protein